MGFFTDAERESLAIGSMILHVVGGEDFTPEAARVVEHEEFFISRILDTDVAPVYSFVPESQTKAELERIASGQITFEAGAQALSREFSRLHVGSSRDGAFFIFELRTTEPTTRLYSLIKYDYREAIEQSQENGGNLLRRIVHAFIADKKAIQKSAVVRVKNGVAELAISTRDRMKPPPAIGSYFETFLNAKRSLSDVELNEKAVEVLRLTLSSNRSLLPGEDVARAFRHAKGVLRDRQEINEDAIADAILAAAGNPEDEALRSEWHAQTRRKIISAKLDGLVFRPDRQVLKRPSLRKVKTVEGVTLTYPDEVGEITVARERTANGGELITIKTERVTEDILVSETAR